MHVKFCDLRKQIVALGIGSCILGINTWLWIKYDPKAAMNRDML